MGLIGRLTGKEQTNEEKLDSAFEMLKKHLDGLDEKEYRKLKTRLSNKLFIYEDERGFEHNIQYGGNTYGCGI